MSDLSALQFIKQAAGNDNEGEDRKSNLRRAAGTAGRYGGAAAGGALAMRYGPQAASKAREYGGAGLGQLRRAGGYAKEKAQRGIRSLSAKGMQVGR